MLAATALAGSAAAAASLVEVQDALAYRLDPVEVRTQVAALSRAGRAEDARRVATLLPIALLSAGDPARAFDAAPAAVEEALALGDARRAFEVSLTCARAAGALGRDEQMLRLYLQAYEFARSALLARAFGMERVTVSRGSPARADFRHELLEIPAGIEIPVSVALEAAQAADRVDRPVEAIDWLERLDPLRAEISPSAEPQLPTAALAELRRFEADATARGRVEAADLYGRRLQDDLAERQETTRRYHAAREEVRSRGIAFARALLLVLLAAVAHVALLLTAARRERGKDLGFDLVPVHGVTVLLEGPGGRPMAWRNSLSDFLRRVGLRWAFWLTVPGAAFGAAAVFRAAWEGATPTSGPATTLLFGLGSVLAAFGVYLLVVLALAPPEASWREVLIDGQGVTVRTAVAGRQGRHIDEVFTFDRISGLSVVAHRVRLLHGLNVRLYLLTLRVPGRAVVLGGASRLEAAVALGQGLAHKLRVELDVEQRAPAPLTAEARG